MAMYTSYRQGLSSHSSALCIGDRASMCSQIYLLHQVISLINESGCSLESEANVVL